MVNRGDAKGIILLSYNNLKFAKPDLQWLSQEIRKSGASVAEEVFLAELDTTGKLYVDLFKSPVKNKPGVI